MLSNLKLLLALYRQPRKAMGRILDEGSLLFGAGSAVFANLVLGLSLFIPIWTYATSAIAEDLACAGLRVALVGRDRAKLDRVREGMGADAGALVEPCDVADRAAVNAMVGRVLEAFGSIDILVCNAGMNVNPRRLETIDPADWDRMIATNLTGAFNLVHAVLPSMRERRHGLLIATTSQCEIFWVENLRIGECFKVTPKTKGILKWQWHR